MPPVHNSELNTSCIVDLLAIVQTTPKRSKKTFGKSSIAVLNTVLTTVRDASEVHVVPDCYDIQESIKTEERRGRCSSKPIKVIIQRRETKLPSDLKRFLSSGTNKTRLVNFMCSEWSIMMPSRLENQRKLFFGLKDGTCLEISRTGVSKIADLEYDHVKLIPKCFFTVSNQRLLAMIESRFAHQTLMLLSYAATITTASE